MAFPFLFPYQEVLVVVRLDLRSSPRQQFYVNSNVNREHKAFGTCFVEMKGPPTKKKERFTNGNDKESMI